MSIALAVIFAALTIANRKDPRKLFIAFCLFVIQSLNCAVSFEGVQFYESAMLVILLPLVFLLLFSQRLWALSLSIILTSCFLLNLGGKINIDGIRLLGLIDVAPFESVIYGKIYEFLTLFVTTPAECAVLALMAFGKLNGYHTDFQVKLRKHII